MKKLALFFTTVFLIGTAVNAKTTNAHKDNAFTNHMNRGYGNSYIFTEGAIEFSVFPDGQFDFYAPNYGPDVNVSINTANVSFSLNSGYDYSPYVQYDDFGAIIQIENIPIYYDFYGRVTQVGNIDINYNSYGRIARVGGLYVHYNNYRNFSHYTGYINVFNQVYVYRPWHMYYAVPAPNFCIVYTRPYRQFYTPVRYHYYRPYSNNYRESVRYTHHRNESLSSGRRGTVASTNRASDRYRQDTRIATDNVANNRANSRSTELANTTTRNATRNDGNIRTTSTTRSNGARATQRQDPASNDRNTGATTQRSVSENERLQNNQRNNVTRSTSTRSSNVKSVKSMPNRKPQAANTRISSNKQQERSTTQNSSSRRSSKQPSSRSSSKI